MSSESVHPLRITKTTPSSSPRKMASAVPRPLSEISPAEKRRNSPSWHQVSPTKKSILSNESSPFQSSPVEFGASPRLFWQNRGTENMLYGGGSGSPSQNRRSSIERLQKASRVKNSNILALEQKHEYDPTRLPQIERPLSKVQEGSFCLSPKPSDVDQQMFDPFRGDIKSSLSKMSPPKPPTPDSTDASSDKAQSPTKDPVSPIKSSLSPSKFKSSFDPETGIWTGDSSFQEDHELPSGRSLHRHAKSVTFDAAPPQINEYEMATPDISTISTNSREGSYESTEDDDEDLLYDPAHMGRHEEDSFDASLEDTDKTPVVGPDDWTRDSPMSHRGDYPNHFDGSPMPESIPAMASLSRPSMSHQRTDSANSNGEHRPLPPLPGLVGAQSTGSGPSSPSISAAAESVLASQRGLPTLPPNNVTSSDSQSFGNGKMSLEERLKLMMLSDDHSGKTAAEQQRERRLRRGNGRERMSSPLSEREATPSILEQAQEADDTIGDISGLGDYQLPPRISRESIMRRVNGNKAFDGESDYHFSSPPVSPERHLPLDPDVPIPSTEDSMMDETIDEGSVIIRRNYEIDDDDDEDLSFFDNSELDIELDQQQPGLQRYESIEEDETDHIGNIDDDSLYSESEAAQEEKKSVSDAEEDDAMTPRVGATAQFDSLAESMLHPTNRSITPPLPVEPTKAETLPQVHIDAQVSTTVITEGESLASLLSPSTPPKLTPKPEYDGSGWGEPDDEYDEEPGTPESVIHRPLPESNELPRESPAIPEQIATVKASGSKLKTRVSNTPSDIAAMREARRQVSAEVPGVPPIPEKHRNRMSRDFDVEPEDSHDDFLERHPSFKNRSLTLDLDMGLSLDKDFERVIEAQKRGYLMRQNTKLVAASDKDGDDTWRSRSASNSPTKKDRPQSWTVEPWNGQARQRSIRKQPGMGGPAPPLPGQGSNAVGLNRVLEEDHSSEIAPPDSSERGRLFVKVMGVKDLDLPIPKNERSWFSLTLDNGVHCVTTAWLELARNAPIGQEFELVVPNDLEFQLTLNVKLEKPAYHHVSVSPVKMNKTKTSTFSRVFASPKKRKEMELRQREEEERFAQQQKEALARQRSAAGSAYDLLSPLAAEDGSFARAYICLKDHESRCFGRPYTADVACFNEWATEEESFACSVKSKRGNTDIVRRAPYKIGKLEVQLLFVPRPTCATDDDMPKSMNSCIRELKAAEERLSQNWEGHLSQQGGDCPYWRRRYFKLVGTRLTAYHEATRQPRATINLANAKRLIDDRRTLTEKETTVKGGKRRKSAFAEEEEGYMFVEEGFRIRFNNGEVIDFYADTADDKDGWMKILSDVIGRADTIDDDSNGVRSRAKWCEVVLKQEDQLRRRTDGRRVHSRTKSTFN